MEQSPGGFLFWGLDAWVWVRHETAVTADAAAPEQTSYRLAMAALILGALTIGAAPILVRLADTGPSATGFWRMIFALPLLAAMSLRGGAGGAGRPGLASILAGLMFALDLACWHYGIRFTSVANATVLPNLTPVLVTLAAWIFLRETPSRIFLVGMAVAVAGSVVMALANSGAGATGTRPHLGDFLSAATALWYGLYFLAVRRARQTQTATRVMAWSTLAASPLLLIIALALHERILPATLMGWWPLAGLGLAHVVGQGSIAWALGRLPTATAALVVLVQPVAAALLAWWVFHETLTPLQALGGALALGGVVLAQARRAPAAG